VKTPDERIRELELIIARLRSEVQTLSNIVRAAAALHPERGWFLGVTHQAFTKGTDDFITVEIWKWDRIDEEWKATGKIIEEKVRDWFLNDGEVIEAGTKVRFDNYDNVLVLTAVYCSPSDDEDVIDSLPSEE